ncbi:hypothetical protein [Paracoccus beibuensis]|uniref:hypothetical protein n=1 Tax=Paracoccus beibuensis TaxID=547602 RepID=UPI00223FF6B0|nr:hypothetical protein [Paracoccus beibuensis]
MTPQADILAEVLAGLVERVTVDNTENGLCVLRLKARGLSVIVVQLGQKRLQDRGAGATFIPDILGQANGLMSTRSL